MSYQRPAFWRVPKNDDDRYAYQAYNRKKVHFNDRVSIFLNIE